LFFAYKVFDKKPQNVSIELENEMHFLGATAMIDPPREEVLQAIDECKTAGIKTVMITGDQVLTAQAIARRLNIYEEGERILEGKELAEMDEEELKRIVKGISVYARVSPEQKLKIVKALQDNGEYVAMTGDGVNDAPSLKQSNIGLAMGITGTDVSKEAAAMILLDDNFATIVKAVKEGRRIYANIKKFILYVLSCNLAEILTIVSAPLIGLAMPLLPIHILWINLVTDGLPGIALTAEPAEKNIMKQAPRPPKEQLFAGGMLGRIITAAIAMSIVVLFGQNRASNLGYNIESQQTLVFTLLCFLQLLNALSVRFDVQSLFNKKLFSNSRMWLAVVATVALQFAIIYVPQLQTIFKTTALDAVLFELIAYCMGVYLAVLEISKIYYRQREKKRLIKRTNEVN
jgi:Ca2+-transporting ATPase